MMFLENQEGPDRHHPLAFRSCLEQSFDLLQIPRNAISGFNLLRSFQKGHCLLIFTRGHQDLRVPHPRIRLKLLHPLRPLKKKDRLLRLIRFRIVLTQKK